MPSRANSRELMLFSRSIEYMCLAFPPGFTSRRLSMRTCSYPRLIRGEVNLAAGGAARALDLDLAHAALGLRAHQVDVQQPVVEPGGRDLDAFGQHESPLKLAGGDATVEIDALAVVLVLAPHDQLIVLDHDAQVIEREARHRQREAQRMLPGLLYVVGRIAVGLSLGDTVEHALEMVEAEKQR